MKIKTYRELIRIPTFEERFAYLKLNGSVGQLTFGFERYLNQVLYRSKEWRAFRRGIIIRDEGCDLATQDYDIYGQIFVHHLNPITIEDIENRRMCVFDPDNVVCSAHNTHNAIHYGDESLLPKLPIERRRGDTCPWRVF